MLTLRRSRRVAVSIVTVALATGITVLGASPAAAAHTIGNDCVDGNEIRYQDNTKYNASLTRGIDEWNAEGSVDFKPDTATTLEDVEMDDVYEPNAAWAGRVVFSSGSKELELNTYYMDGYSTAYKHNVMIHEMGHCVGIDDHTWSGWDAIMYEAVRGWQYVHSHDSEDYDVLWS
jgi:hypothetical protein